MIINILRVVAGLLVGTLCFALGTLIHDSLFGGNFTVSIHGPKYIWLYAIAGFTLGFKFAVKVYSFIIEGIWQIF